jgi:hypothetical protein
VHDDELELDVDEIPDHVLSDLFKFVKAIRETTGADAVEDDDYYEDPADAKPTSTSTGRKKNKPMSAREQESKIQQVRQQLQRFDGGSGSDRGGHANGKPTTSLTAYAGQTFHQPSYVNSAPTVSSAFGGIHQPSYFNSAPAISSVLGGSFLGSTLHSPASTHHSWTYKCTVQNDESSDDESSSSEEE